jgi:hypothetical protein
MLLNQCLNSRQRSILESEMGGKFTAAGSYKQSYPQKLGRLGATTKYTRLSALRNCG